MTEVYLTVEQAAEALGLSYYTVIRRCKAGGYFPNAKLREKARRLGYRIPSLDVLAHAREEGEDVVAQAEAVIARVRREHEKKLATLGSGPAVIE